MGDQSALVEKLREAAGHRDEQLEESGELLAGALELVDQLISRRGTVVAPIMDDVAGCGSPRRWFRSSVPVWSRRPTPRDGLGRVRLGSSLSLPPLADPSWSHGPTTVGRRRAGVVDEWWQVQAVSLGLQARGVGGRTRIREDPFEIRRCCATMNGTTC